MKVTIRLYSWQGVRIIGVFEICCVFYDEINIFHNFTTEYQNNEIQKLVCRQSFELFLNFRILC